MKLNAAANSIIASMNSVISLPFKKKFRSGHINFARVVYPRPATQNKNTTSLCSLPHSQVLAFSKTFSVVKVRDAQDVEIFSLYPIKENECLPMKILIPVLFPTNKRG